MKTASLTYLNQHFIDLAPLAARYDVLTKTILTYLAAGQLREVLRYSYKVTRLIRVYTRLDTQNRLWARKLEMLSDKSWRERVLRDLGGIRKLTVWEAARDRFLARRDKTAFAPKEPEPSWLFTPDRIAESERLKAHARNCARAGAQSHVVRSRVKTDFDGLFRLPPMPRARAQVRHVKVYTQNSVSDYAFNPIPFEEKLGFGPATVWPVEFYAAAEMEHSISVIPHNSRSDADGGSIVEGVTLTLDPPSSCISLRELQRVRDDKGSKIESESRGFPCVPLRIALDSKTYRDIFENPV